MSRACRFCISLLVVLLGAVAVAAQPLPDAEVSCPRAAFPPVLDGRLNEWPRLPQVAMSGPEDWRPAAAEFAEYGGPEDISAEIWLAWDNQALYLALMTRDDELVRVRSAAEIDRGDSLVVSLTDVSTGEVNQFVVALLRAASLVWRAEPAADAGNVRTIGRALWARPEEDGGSQVIYELAIPWSELRPIRPIPGRQFALVVSACDDDGEGMEGCLEHPVSVAVSAGGIGAPVGPTPPPPSPPTFGAPEVARFDQQCFTFHGQDVLVFGGRVDYTRLPRETWSKWLALLKAAGMNAIGVTVPWSHHQPTPGETDLADLRAFLELCKDTGLSVQMNVGPYLGEDWDAGGIPGWVIAIPSAEAKQAAVEGWYQAILPVVASHQLTVGGAIASVIARPLPDAADDADAWELAGLSPRLMSAKVEVPVLTANAPAARDNRIQPLANLLDTLSFYAPTAPAQIVLLVETLADEENGPAVIGALRGDYRTPAAARRSLDRVRVALAAGATAITLSDFAPGLPPSPVREPGDWTDRGVIDAAGARTPGYGEVRLLGGFLQRLGPQLARAMPAEGLVQADDSEVRAAARLSSQEGFIFLWDEQRAAPHQVRLTYIEPGTEATVNIPEAGAIYLPPGGAKIIPLDVPLGRGVLRYTTSEIADIHRLGERTLLVLYGDPGTPGEMALRWPGPPLVSGEVARQSWDPETRTLVLDYYHGEDDQYLLVDEVEIAVFSRARAALAGQVAGEQGAVTLSAGVHVSGGSLDAADLEAVLQCPEGVLQATAALPKRPSSVTVDGKPVDFTFAPPARIASFEVTTESFERGQRPASIWDQLGRAVVGGLPKLYARFDRAWFRADAAAPGSWRPLQRVGPMTDALGRAGSAFVSLRVRFDAAGTTEMIVSGCTDPTLVSVNGRLVAALSGSASERRADITEFLKPGEDEIGMLIHLLPRAHGLAGLQSRAKKLPTVRLIGEEGEIVLEEWEFVSDLRGEEAGWAGADVDLRQWHLLRLGPWRKQGRAPAEVWGVGWYRVPFGLPGPKAWNIPYRLRLTLHGTAELYLNGRHFATCGGGGEYVLPLPTPPLKQGGDNLLAMAVYGAGPQTGLHELEIAADKDRMTRRRVVEIRF